MTSEEYYELAANAVRRKKYPQAMGYFIKALEKEPESIEARKGLRAVCVSDFNGKAFPAIMSGLGELIQIVLLKMKKKPEEGLVACAKFLCKHPNHLWTLKQMVHFAEAKEYKKTMAHTYQVMAEASPHDADLVVEAADFLSDQGDVDLYEKAVNMMSTLCQEYPTDTDLSGERNRIEAKKVVNKLENAQKHSDVLKDKDAAKKLEEESQQIRTDEDLLRAIARAEERERAEPESPRAKEVVADLYFRKGDLPKTIEKYDEAIALDPNNQNAQSRRGDAIIRQVELQLTVMKKKLPKLSGEEQDAMKQRIKDHRKKLQNTKLEEYGRRLKVNPNDLSTRFELGTLFFNSKAFDKAIQQFQRAVQDARLAFRSNQYLGHCFKEKKLFDLAIKEFTNATKRSGGSGQDKLGVHYEIGLCYEISNRTSEALEVYKSILEKDYGFRDVATKVEALSQDNT